MNDLVTLHNGQLVTTTLAIAEGTENEHASVIALARKYQKDLEEFGPCRFEIDVVKRPQGGGSEREIAILNEQQSTLLLTYMRNSDIVRAFKKRLVRRFYEMAQELRGQTDRASLLDSPKTRALQLTPIAMEAAKAFGFRDSQAALSADRAIQTITGVSVLDLMGQRELLVAEQDALLTVSDIADRLGWKAREVNPRLTLAGLQDEHRDHKGRLYYEVTELGRGFGVYLDTNKKHGDGTPVRQLKWRASIVDFLRQHYPAQETAA